MVKKTSVAVQWAALGSILVLVSVGTIWALQWRKLGIFLLLLPTFLLIHYVLHTAIVPSAHTRTTRIIGLVGAASLLLLLGTQVSFPFAWAVLVGGVLLWIPWLYERLQKI